MSDQRKYASKLSGARILIIGGSSGMGFAVAEACLEHGAFVTICSSNPEKLASAVSRLQASYPSCRNRLFSVTADLSIPSILESSLRDLLSETTSLNSGRGLKHVVFTAGDALAVTPLEGVDLETTLAAGQIRFFAPYLLAKLLPQYLEPSCESSYTITTAPLGKRPLKDWSVVALYTGGHGAMVRALALDLMPIRVNGISAGVIDTELWDSETADKKSRILAHYATKMTTGRVGRPQDITESFLATLKDYNMTGTVITSDGGGLLM